MYTLICTVYMCIDKGSWIFSNTVRTINIK